MTRTVGNDIKTSLCEDIESLLPSLVDLGDYLHQNPETAFEEYLASSRLCTILRNEGFDVEQGIGGLETALRARSTGGRNGPVVAVLAEYDALPGLGHACGHNLIAAMSTGAAIAVKHVLDASPLNGTIILMGTPAEEKGGGKGILVSKGCFDGIDCAIMVHPASHTMVADSSLASTRLILRYRGKAAHASTSPWNGANALEAAIQTFNLVNAWRCQLHEPSRINGIITAGGTAINIIPEYAEIQFGVRAACRDYLDELVERVGSCARAAATGMAVTVEIERVGKGYGAIRNNPVLEKCMAENFRIAGETVLEKSGDSGLGSTDMGNVTEFLPGVHCLVKLKPGMEPHTSEFAQACAKPDTARTIAAGAKAMGMTVIDLFANPDLVREARHCFKGTAS